MNHAPDDDALGPLRLSEIVLRTGRYDAMKQWYGNVLGVGPNFEYAPDIHSPVQAGTLPARPIRLCFFRVFFEYPFQQVLAVFEMADTSERSSASSGLHHMQLSAGSRSRLATRCAKLARDGIVPRRAADHGPTTSCYYADPDGNVVELAATNHDDVMKYQAARASDEFRRNPFGRPLDPEWFTRESEKALATATRS